MMISPAALVQFKKMRMMLAKVTCTGEREAADLLECCSFLDAVTEGLIHEKHVQASQQTQEAAS